MVQFWKPEQLEISVEEVMWGQGGNPEMARRRPKLVEVAEKAIELGVSTLEPNVMYQEFEIDLLENDTVTLTGGGVLLGELLGQHLNGAEKVLIMVCTVGAAIDEFANQQMGSDPILGLALVGFGSAAAEKLANAACTKFEAQTIEKGLQASLPLIPGMNGWEVSSAQSQIFKIVPAEEIGITLTDSALMMPTKSVTILLGIGKALNHPAIPCDSCAISTFCTYKDRYQQLYNQ